MPTELTREIIENAFDEMGRLAGTRGMVVEIAVYGGSCLILASDIRNASGDVDAVFLAEGQAVREIADQVASRLGLPHDWINEGVRRMAPPPGDPQPNLILSGEYPRIPNSIVGLRVHLPTPAYMLAMKILANRVAADTEKIESDLKDAVALMKITGLTTEGQLVALLRECYPHLPGIVVPTVYPRMQAKIDTLLDEYRRAETLIRPGTLAQVLRLVASGEKLRFCLAGFLDEFYGDDSAASRAGRVAEDPGLIDDGKTNALMGAIGEHLSIRWNLGAAPEWVCEPKRFLDSPWFMGHERMKGFFLVESPLAFRRRFIFTEAEPLRRASMPRDGRWWAYETIRSGLTPTAEEQAELDGRLAPVAASLSA